MAGMNPVKDYLNSIGDFLGKIYTFLKKYFQIFVNYLQFNIRVRKCVQQFDYDGNIISAYSTNGLLFRGIGRKIRINAGRCVIAAACISFCVVILYYVFFNGACYLF